MTPSETVDQFIKLVTGGDLDGALELVTDDVEYDNVPMGKNIGPQAMKDFLGAMEGGVEQTEFVIHRSAATGNVVMNERSDRFLVKGTWHELPVCGVFEVTDDGKIRLWRDYFDMAPVNALIGALSG
jgi:limonene-1,2-epoxide hydrolase